MNGFGLENILHGDNHTSLPASATDNEIVARIKAHGEKFLPSNEQLEIIKSALTGKDIKVQAFAGTGKTTTIRLVSQALCKTSLYIAFNKAIIEQATGLVKTSARTAHSIAFRDTIGQHSSYKEKYANKAKLWSNKTLQNIFYSGLAPLELATIKKVVKVFIKSADFEIGIDHLDPKFLQKLKQSNLSKRESVEQLLCEMAEKVKCIPKGDTHNVREKYLRDYLHNDKYKKPQKALDSLFSAREQSELINKIIKNAATYSSGSPISVEDFPSPEYRRISTLENDNEQEMLKLQISRLLDSARLFWEAIIDPTSDTPLDDDCYLKLWQLQKPILNFDVIYIDEAQDLDPVMLNVLQSQPAQKVWLGDEYQQIYKWRGAVNALDIIKCPYKLFLTETFRFPPIIASSANKVLAKLGAPKRIITRVSETDLTKNESYVYIARTNKSLFSQAMALAKKQQQFNWKGFNTNILLRNCSQVIQLYKGQATGGSYEDFSTYQELLLHLDDNPANIMKRAVDLCEKYNFNLNEITIVLKEIEQYNCTEAKVQLITAHQSKGLEWDFVLLADDFNNVGLSQREGDESDMSEWNLLYVAITRAKKNLQLYSQTISTLFDSNATVKLRLEEATAKTVGSYSHNMPPAELFYDKQSRALYTQIIEHKLKPPIIGYDCKENNRVIGMLEFAWPEAKVGVYLDDQPVKPSGWVVYPISEFSSDISKLSSVLSSSNSI